MLAYTAMLTATSVRAAMAVGAMVLFRSIVASALLSGMYAYGKRQAEARGKSKQAG